MACEKLIRCRDIRPNAVIRLFCFPWAGGGSQYYASWFRNLPDEIEVNSLVLPGREDRHKDPIYKSHTELVDEVINTILGRCQEKPFAFFGHSFGSYMSYEVAKTLKRQHNLEPKYLFLSGTSAPHSQRRKENVIKFSQMTDDELLQIMYRIGGTPLEIFENEELRQMYLPPMKADFTIIENYDVDKPSDDELLSCPVSVSDGTQDKPHDLDAWSEVTKGSFTKTMYPGGHMYLLETDNKKDLTKHIMQCLKTHSQGYMSWTKE